MEILANFVLLSYIFNKAEMLTSIDYLFWCSFGQGTRTIIILITISIDQTQHEYSHNTGACKILENLTA